MNRRAWEPWETRLLKKRLCQGRTYTEIGQELGRPPGSCKSRARVCAMPRAEGQGRRTDLEN